MPAPSCAGARARTSSREGARHPARRGSGTARGGARPAHCARADGSSRSYASASPRTARGCWRRCWPGRRRCSSPSANGVRAFAAASARRDLAAYAVGDATAAAARQLAGFRRDHQRRRHRGGSGSPGAMSRVRRPSEGALIHAAGSAVAGDLAAMLGGAGFELRRAVLYAAPEPADAVQPAGGGCSCARAGPAPASPCFSLPAPRRRLLGSPTRPASRRSAPA